MTFFSPVESHHGLPSAPLTEPGVQEGRRDVPDGTRRHRSRRGRHPRERHFARQPPDHLVARATYAGRTPFRRELQTGRQILSALRLAKTLVVRRTGWPRRQICPRRVGDPGQEGPSQSNFDAPAPEIESGVVRLKSVSLPRAT